MNAAIHAAVVYTGLSLLASGAFLTVTLLTGDYDWTARVGGAFWMWLLSMIILMPLIIPWARARRQ